MFKSILIPVDGSTTSGQVIEKASAIALAFQSTVTVVSVIDIYAFAGLGMDAAYGQAEYMMAANSEANLAVTRAKEFFEAAGVTVTTSVLEGQVIYKTILEAAKSANADMIVMGSHGRKGLEKLVLGSVAAQVLSHAHLPVMIVRE